MLRLTYSLAALLVISALTGCNTFDRRAQQKSAAYAALSPADQARLQKQLIQVGDTQDMVFIAMGKPDEEQSATTAAGETTTWIYNRYWQEYQGETYAGVRRQAVRDPKTGTVGFYYIPVSRPLYAQREQPVLRVSFMDGKATVIEQAKK